MILGLDQSANCGFALGLPGSTPRWGVFYVPNYGEHEGRTFWAVEKWLVDFIKTEGITHVFWEAVYIPEQRRGDTRFLNLHSTYKLICYANAVQAACVDEDRGVNIYDACVKPNVWRKHFLGSGGLRREAAKIAAVKQCANRGWYVDSQDAAEAVGIWDYGCTVVDKEYRWNARISARRREAAP
jgi:hypothetical protein